MAKIAFISHPYTLLHLVDGNHPDPFARISNIKNRMLASDVKEKLPYICDSLNNNFSRSAFQIVSNAFVLAHF
jgi:hypothetical protein